MKRAIAMRCTKEQWESIKHNFKEEDVVDEVVSSCYPYLINYYRLEESYGIGFWRITDDKETHEVFNADIFLEACGIESENFKITKDTILKYQMKDEFPELFEEKLVVGKWYISSVWLINYQEDDRCYGVRLFDWSWRESLMHNIKNHEANNYREATKEEVETALKKEVSKRYPIGTYVKSLVTKSIALVENTSEISFYFKMNVVGYADVRVFENGKWAEIIETITKAEAEKLLNKKIV